jgi:hypothetical protein
VVPSLFPPRTSKGGITVQGARMRRAKGKRRDRRLPAATKTDCKSRGRTADRRTRPCAGNANIMH